MAQVQQDAVRRGRGARLQLHAARRAAQLAAARRDRPLRRRPLLVLHATRARQVHGREHDGAAVRRHAVQRRAPVQRHDERVARPPQGQVSGAGVGVGAGGRWARCNYKSRAHTWFIVLR